MYKYLNLIPLIAMSIAGLGVTYLAFQRENRGKIASYFYGSLIGVMILAIAYCWANLWFLY